MKLSNQGLSSKEEFKLYIESIGFKYNVHRYYVYKNNQIDLYSSYYDFWNGSEWIFIVKLNDLTPLKQIERSYKLKKILG